MMMQRIRRDDPEKVYVAVMNANTTKGLIGHGMYWSYGTLATQGSGYQVTHSPTATTNAINPALLAGVVAGKNINYNEFGSLQCYGEHGNVAWTNGASADPYTSQMWAASTHTAAKFTNLIMKPAHVLLTATSAGMLVNSGFFGFIALKNTLGATASAAAAAAYWPGGYCVAMNNPGATITATSYTYTTGGTIKAFVKCLN